MSLERLQNGLAKGDTFLSSSGDNGATGASKQHKESTTYPADGSVSPGPVTGWPTLGEWDMTTGCGSPRVGPFVADLATQ